MKTIPAIATASVMIVAAFAGCASQQKSTEPAVSQQSSDDVQASEDVPARHDAIIHVSGVS